MGRSRGGLTTKIHALVDALGRPIRLKLTEGQAHDGRSACDMFDTVQAGNILLADRAYDSDLLSGGVSGLRDGNLPVLALSPDGAQYDDGAQEAPDDELDDGVLLAFPGHGLSLPHGASHRRHQAWGSMLP